MEGNKHVLDPEGDAYLELKPSGEVEASTRYLVSTTILRLGSPVFRAMFQPHFAEGHALASEVQPVIKLEDDNLEAMELLLNILHMKHDKIPQVISLIDLDNFLTAMDKYDCGGCMQVWVKKWMNELTSDMRSGDPKYVWRIKDVENFLMLAKKYKVDSVTGFLTHKLVLGSHVERSDRVDKSLKLDEDKEDFIHWASLERLNMKLMNIMIDRLNREALRMIDNGQDWRILAKKCVGCGSDFTGNNCDFCGTNKYKVRATGWCDKEKRASLFLKCLAEQQLWPWGPPGYNRSLQESAKIIVAIPEHFQHSCTGKNECSLIVMWKSLASIFAGPASAECEIPDEIMRI